MTSQPIKLFLALVGIVLVSTLLEVDGQTVQHSNAKGNCQCQAQINQLEKRLDNQIAKENSDFQLATRTMNRLQEEVSILAGRVSFVQTSISNANSAIASLRIDLAGANGAIDKLEDLNKIWRSNFQVVNRTFAELKKKNKMAIANIQTPVFVIRSG